MDDGLKDILENSSKDFDNQKLMEYLSQQLSKEESHDLEKSMVDDPLLNDAMEGLEQLKHKKNINQYVYQINYDLQKKLSKKQSRKEKRKFKDQPWVYFTIIFLLVLLVVCFIVIKFYS